jgi:hypothetical protein
MLVESPIDSRNAVRVDSACLIDPTAVCRLCFRLCVISFLKAAAFSNYSFLYSLDRGNLDAQMKNVIHSALVCEVHPPFNLRSPCWVSGEVLESAELIKDCVALVPSFHLVLLRDFSKVKDLLATQRCYSIRGLLMI